MHKAKRSLILAAWVILISFVALTVATYAWMSIATSYKVSDLDIHVISENAMEIAFDNNGEPGEWMHVVDANRLLDPDATLRPITWSAKDGAFYAPRYGLDGRIGYMDPYLVASVNTDPAEPTSSEAEEEAGDGYLIAIDLWLRTGTSRVVTYLVGPDGLRGDEDTIVRPSDTTPEAEADTQGNATDTQPETGVATPGAGDGTLGGTYVVGLPVWDPDAICHYSGGNGAENVLRIGFLTYDEAYEDGHFYIYEPNAPEDGYVTRGIDGDPLEGEGTLIRQYASTWSEQDPVLHGSVNYHMGEFATEDTEMFSLVANTPRRVTLFIWLEGQDPQCQNSISAGELLLNLQLGAIADNGEDEIIRPERGRNQDE